MKSLRLPNGKQVCKATGDVISSEGRNLVYNHVKDFSVEDSFEMTSFKVLKYSIFVFIISILFSNLLFAQSAEQIITEGDSLAKVFDHQKALEKYLQADKMEPNNWNIYWRLSKAYVDIADKMPNNNGTQEDAQLAKYQTGYDYADKAVKLAPSQSITYLRRAIANGKIALFKGVFSVAGVVNKVREDCEKAIKLGNGGNYFQSLAHYVLGRTHAKVSEKWAPARSVLGLGWADIDTAIVEYNKAIKLRPNFRMFYLDLAKAYIREDEYSKAREALKNVINSPKEDQSDDDNLVEAKNLMEAIKDE
jgi:tetratricopeptide (TPR) repeat protein